MLRFCDLELLHFYKREFGHISQREKLLPRSTRTGNVYMVGWQAYTASHLHQYCFGLLTF